MAVFLPDLDLLFVHIPKTAGTWVKSVLRASDLRVEEAHGLGSHGLPHWYSDQGKRFCFVRKPADWYFSLWRGLKSSWPDQREVKPLHQEKTWSPVRMLTYLASEKDFVEFAARVRSDQTGFVSRMFEWYIGPPGAPSVDAVGRMEFLADDLQAILAHFGYRGKLNLLPPENEGPKEMGNGMAMDMLRWTEVVAYDRFYTRNGPFFLTR